MIKEGNKSSEKGGGDGDVQHRRGGSLKSLKKFKCEKEDKNAETV